MRLATRGGRPLRSIASANFIGASLIAAENSCVYRRPLIAKDSCASRIIAEMSVSLLPGPICDCIAIYFNFFVVSRSVQRNGMERCSLGGGLLCLLEVAESIKKIYNASLFSERCTRILLEEKTRQPRALKRKKALLGPIARSKEIFLGLMRASVGRQGGASFGSRASRCGASQANGHRPFCPR